MSTRASESPVRILPDAWYTDADLRLILGLPGVTLRKARRTGMLRASRRGQITWHLGAWVDAWLKGEHVEEREAVHA